MEHPQDQRDAQTEREGAGEKPPDERNPKQKNERAADRNQQPRGTATHRQLVKVDSRMQTPIGFHYRNPGFSMLPQMLEVNRVY
jgi:hypothetical protein